eukprot:12355772-Alexandrium_andersonii.AAC.1
MVVVEHAAQALGGCHVALVAQAKSHAAASGLLDGAGQEAIRGGADLQQAEAVHEVLHVLVEVLLHAVHAVQDGGALRKAQPLHGRLR